MISIFQDHICTVLEFRGSQTSTLSKDHIYAVLAMLRVSTIHALRSLIDFNLWDMMNFLNQQAVPDRNFEWVDHTLLRRDLHDFLMQPGMMDTWIHPQAFLHFLSPPARQLMQLMLSRL